jgi:two-component system sensor histidine kinase SenX3
MAPALAVVAALAVVLMAVQWRRAALLRAGLDAQSALADVLEDRLEQAREDNLRLAAALDDVSQGVVLVDADGRERLRNRAAGAYVGARHGEALIDQAIAEELRRARETGPCRRNLDLFGPPRRMLAITASPLAGGGAVAVVDDVSERRRLDAIRRDFVANISHELKTPVGALGALAEAISMTDDGDVVRRLSERMTSEAMRVGQIIDDLLALSRIEEDETPVSEQLRLLDVVDEAIGRVRPVADARQIAFDASDVGAAHSVLGDPRQLVTAVANLLDNACKYSDDRSSVSVRSRVERSWVELEVEDHGVGIPAADLDRVFERFYRVDRSRARETGGTGLGLAIVRHVASNHRGEVRVSSIEGAGSTFVLRLPGGNVAVAS